MCGIAGFIDNDRLFRDPEGELARMAWAIRSRGPDDQQVWFDPESGVGFGFRRLAIQDLSVEGRQPMRSPSGRFTIVFNGEVYNFRELRNELVRAGFSFRGGSDTEVMLAGFEAWGVEGALARFVGMFAFALWDSRDRTVHLVRDRLGVKPLYWGRMGPGERTIVFGSELKAILALPFPRPEIQRDVAGIYTRYGYVPSPHCIFKGLRKVLPGQGIRIDTRSGSIREFGYWSAKSLAERESSRPIHDHAEALDALDELVQDAIRLRLVADVPLCSFLSGGVDSALITAIAARASSGRLRTFTIGFEDAAYDEASFARDIARAIGTDHTELYVTARDALDTIPKLGEIYDEPFADSSAIPSYLVCRLASRSVKVALAGDGGDEYFGGYPRYLLASRLERQVDRWPYGGRRVLSESLRLAADLAPGAVALFDRRIPGSRMTRPADRLRTLAAVLSVRDRRELYPTLASITRRPFDYLVDETALTSPMTEGEWEPDLECAIIRASVRDMASYLPDEILAKMDRVSMANGLEVREPLTDHRLAEFSFRLPARLKYANGRNKILLRDLAARHLPRELLERPKMGFGVPIDGWLREELREWGEELLARDRLEAEGVFDADAVRALWNRHQAGVSQSHLQLWNILMFQQWKERWNDTTSEPADGSIASRFVADLPEAAEGTSSRIDPAHHLEPDVAKRQLASGSLWGILQNAIQKGSSFLTYLIAAWTLLPEDLGQFTTAVSIATILTVVYPGAAGDLLIRHQATRRVWETACLWMAILAGLMVILMTVGLAPAIAAIYGSSLLGVLAGVVAFRILLDAASGVFAAKLRLQSRFRLLSMIENSISIATLVLTAILALAGAGPWALLLPIVAMSFVRLGILARLAPIPLRRPGFPMRMRRIWSDFRAGGLQHYLNGLTQTADYFALSLFHASDVLGRYTVAYQIASTVHILFSHTVAGIAQPIMSRLQYDPERKRAVYLGTLQLTLALAAPACISLSLVSPTLVHLVLPERWDLAWISLSILAIAMLALHPIPISAAFMRARGKFNELLRFQILFSTTLTVAVLVASAVGTARHVAFAVLATGLLFGPWSIIAALRHTEMPLVRTVVGTYVPALIAAAIGALPQAAVSWIRTDPTWTNLTWQAVAALAGLPLFLAAIRLLSPPVYRQLMLGVRRLLGRIPFLNGFLGRSDPQDGPRTGR